MNTDKFSNRRGAVPIIIIVLGVLFLGTVGFGLYAGKEIFRGPPLVATSKEPVNASFSFPKNEYVTSEPFENVSAKVEYGGESRRFVVLIYFSQEGVSRTGGIFKSKQSIGVNAPANFPLSAFSHTETAYAIQKYFSEPGTYKFRVVVYDCVDVEGKLGVDCGGDLAGLDERIVANSVPELASAEKSLKVIAVAPAPTPALAPVSPKTGPLDCGLNNFDCLINAARTCTISKMTQKGPVDFFGVVFDATAFYEIRGYQGASCVFYQKLGPRTARFSDELKQQLLSQGKTQEEIASAETELTQQQQETVGWDGSCKVKSADLVAILTRWKNGEISTNDFGGAECTGKAFGK